MQTDDEVQNDDDNVTACILIIHQLRLPVRRIALCGYSVSVRWLFCRWIQPVMLGEAKPPILGRVRPKGPNPEAQLASSAGEVLGEGEANLLFTT